MRKWWITLLAACLAIGAGSAASLAETGSGSTGLTDIQNILQQALSVKQIDEELLRLKQNEENMKNQITELESEKSKQEAWADETRKRAGRVIRSYYTGERQSLWMLLLNSKSLSQAVDLLVYLDRIMSRDQMLLQQSVEAQHRLTATRDQIGSQLTQVAVIRDTLISERERQVALEAAVAAAIAESEAAEELQRQIDSLNNQWTEVGKPKFRAYLEALRASLTLDNLKSRLGFVVKVGKMTLFVKDSDINELLQEQNSLFENFKFKLEQGYMIGSGVHEGVFLSIKGHFMITEDALITLKIDELKFNDYTLDESTVRALEEEFSLSFDPATFDPKLKLVPVDVRHEPEQLYIDLAY